MTTPSIVLPPELLDDNATKGPVQGAVPVPGPKADLATLDLSLPLSTLLKSGTKLAHTNAEHSAGAIALANGSLELTEYVRYLTILWVVYQTLENELDKTVATPPHAGADGAVEAIDALWSDRKGKGRMLRRSPGLAEDINYYCEYLGLVKSAAKDQKTGLPSPAPPIVQDILSSPPVDLATFKSHLETLGATHPGLLLAHAYVRYLGDLSGGQLIAAKIRRVYGIPPPPAGGTAFYEFDLDGQGGRGVTATLTKHAHSADAAGKQDESSLYERKKQVEGIKNWFRDCMDMNVQDDEGLKAQLVQEAITSFHLSTRVFAMLNPPANSEQASTAPAANAPHGHNSTNGNTLHQRKSAAAQTQQVPASPFQKHIATEKHHGDLASKITKVQEDAVKAVDRGTSVQAKLLLVIALLFVWRLVVGWLGAKGYDVLDLLEWVGKKLVGTPAST